MRRTADLHFIQAPGAMRPGGTFGNYLTLFKGAIRWMRSQWRCFKHTSGAHEKDLYTGVCRYCGARMSDRL